jgi:hypothetical protein
MEEIKSRTDLLKFIIDNKSISKYLEIGIQNGINFKEIDVDFKLGIDPNPKYKSDSNMLYITSDEFFKIDNPLYTKFDLIFIDGYHSFDQSLSDLKNSLNIIKPNGIIVMHDALPHTLEYTSMNWCGTTYKTIIWAALHQELNVKTFEGDHGCAVITKSKKTKFKENLIDESMLDFSKLWENDANIVNKCNSSDIKEYILNLK